MLITKINDLPELDIKCPICNCSFKAVMFSRAFSSDTECICSSCGVQASVSPYSEVIKYIESKNEGNRVEEYFKSCECGGKFWVVGRRYDLYRCPNCQELMDENFVIACLGIDRMAWQSKAPFCGHVEIDGEEIEYTNPGLETIGHINEDIWNHFNDNPQFQNALNADHEFKMQCDRHREAINDIQKSIELGILPQEVYLMSGLDAFLFFKHEGTLCAINSTELGLAIELIEECRDWARLGSYIEDGVWGKGDYPPEKFKKTTWDEYYQLSLEVQKKVQIALGGKTIVKMTVEPSGECFFGEKA